MAEVSSQYEKLALRDGVNGIFDYVSPYVNFDVSLLKARVMSQSAMI